MLRSTMFVGMHLSHYCFGSDLRISRVRQKPYNGPST